MDYSGDGTIIIYIIYIPYIHVNIKLLQIFSNRRQQTIVCENYKVKEMVCVLQATGCYIGQYNIRKEVASSASFCVTVFIKRELHSSAIRAVDSISYIKMNKDNLVSDTSTISLVTVTVGGIIQTDKLIYVNI